MIPKKELLKSIKLFLKSKKCSQKRFCMLKSSLRSFLHAAPYKKEQFVKHTYATKIYF